MEQEESRSFVYDCSVKHTHTHTHTHMVMLGSIVGIVTRLRAGQSEF